MVPKNVKAMYFSPTDTTRKLVTRIAEALATKLGSNAAYIDFTLPESRQETLHFCETDIVVLGIPVYAGRVPNILLNYLNSLTGHGALAVGIVLYGNRNYDDALIELKDILQAHNFTVIAGGAFVGEHSFSNILAKNRPDQSDMYLADNFANQVYQKISNHVHLEPLVVKGNTPYRKYYMPQKTNGEPADIRKVTPKTNSNCIHCKLCVSVCPTGSIDQEDVSKLNGICIKCGACIKKCPVQAKYYDDENYLRHKRELEIDFALRKEPDLFL